MYKQVSGRRSTKFAKNGPNQQRFSMRLQWINEFSDLGDQMSQVDTIKLAKAQSSLINDQSSID